MPDDAAAAIRAVAARFGRGEGNTLEMCSSLHRNVHDLRSESHLAGDFLRLFTALESWEVATGTDGESAAETAEPSLAVSDAAHSRRTSGRLRAGVAHSKAQIGGLVACSVRGTYPVRCRAGSFLIVARIAPANATGWNGGASTGV